MTIREWLDRNRQMAESIEKYLPLDAELRLNGLGNLQVLVESQSGGYIDPRECCFDVELPGGGTVIHAVDEEVFAG